MNVQQPLPVNFRFITKETRTAPGLNKKMNPLFYEGSKITSFYKPILFIA
jgi:hypothetical protein